jgi:hypothetical protein
MSSPTAQISLTDVNSKFELKLQNNVLEIMARHNDECFVWHAKVEGSLEQNESSKKELKKSFIVDLEPEEIFELFDQYQKKKLENNIEISFPSLFKHENDDLSIEIKFKRTFGKQQYDIKEIVLHPKNIPKDVITGQKLENFRTNTINKLGNLDKKCIDMESEIAELKKKINELLANK